MRLLSTLALAALVAPAALAQTSTFEGLGALPGDLSSGASAVSADGQTVVGSSSDGNGSGEAFRWTAGDGMVGLGDVPGGGPSSEANGVSADGQTVVGYGDGDLVGDEAFRWTSAGGLVPLGGCATGDGQAIAFGASGDGATVVGWCHVAVAGDPNGRLVAVRWGPAGTTTLGDLPGGAVSGLATAVSTDGEVAVGSSYGENGREAFRWTAGDGMVGLGDLPGSLQNSRAVGVSADGSVVVGAAASEASAPFWDEAFRWTAAGGMVGLGDLPGGEFSSEATAVSGDGRVVVGVSSVSGGKGGRTVPFIWTAEQGMRDLRAVLETDYGLDLTGWELRRATGVSADGTVIVGFGVRVGSGVEAWRAVLGTGTTALPDAPAAATSLAPVAPNPVAGPAAVRFQFATATRVHLAVYDVLGREVALLVNAERPAGVHIAALDASRLAPGVYVVRLSAGADVRSQRLTVAR